MLESLSYLLVSLAHWSRRLLRRSAVPLLRWITLRRISLWSKSQSIQVQKFRSKSLTDIRSEEDNLLVAHSLGEVGARHNSGEVDLLRNRVVAVDSRAADLDQEKMTWLLESRAQQLTVFLANIEPAEQN